VPLYESAVYLGILFVGTFYSLNSLFNLSYLFITISLIVYTLVSYSLVFIFVLKFSPKVNDSNQSEYEIARASIWSNRLLEVPLSLLVMYYVVHTYDVGILFVLAFIYYRVSDTDSRFQADSQYKSKIQNPDILILEKEIEEIKQELIEFRKLIRDNIYETKEILQYTTRESSNNFSFEVRQLSRRIKIFEEKIEKLENNISVRTNRRKVHKKYRYLFTKLLTKRLKNSII